MRGAALWMLLRDLFEMLTRLLVHHVVKQANSAVEFRVYRGVARDLEGDFANITVIVPAFLGGRRSGDGEEDDDRQRGECGGRSGARVGSDTMPPEEPDTHNASAEMGDGNAGPPPDRMPCELVPA